MTTMSTARLTAWNDKKAQRNQHPTTAIEAYLLPTLSKLADNT